MDYGAAAAAARGERFLCVLCGRAVRAEGRGGAWVRGSVIELSRTDAVRDGPSQDAPAQPPCKRVCTLRSAAATALTRSSNGIRMSCTRGVLGEGRIGGWSGWLWSRLGTPRAPSGKKGADFAMQIFYVNSYFLLQHFNEMRCVLLDSIRVQT